MNVASIQTALATADAPPMTAPSPTEGTVLFAAILAGLMPGAKPLAAQATPAPEGSSELETTDENLEAEGQTASEAAAASTGADASVGLGLDPAAHAGLLAASASTTRVERSTAALDPALQEKLARVAERMREAGHSVKVAETYRTQERQNALFAQGRSAPGPVVTWTQRSRHTEGRAVDVVIDGGQADSRAYELLQQIARDEGLRTLGAKDPGHLELPGARSVDVQRPETVATASVSAAGREMIARVAEIAAVARPADVAAVATVASMHGTLTTAPATPGYGRRRTGTLDLGGSGSETLGAGAFIRDPAALSALSMGPESLRALTPVDTMQRVLDATMDQPARPLSQLTVALENNEQLQVAMRGQSLRAGIDAADTVTAQHLMTREGELARALARHAIDLEELRVRAPQAQTQQQGDTSSRHRGGQPDDRRDPRGGQRR